MSGKRHAKDDPHSFGNLLLRGGHCTQADIELALAHADELMGEYLVREEIITRDILELVLAQQAAAKGGNGAIIKFAQIAVERTKNYVACIDNLAVEKLK